MVAIILAACATHDSTRPPNSDLFVLPQFHGVSQDAQVAWYGYGAARAKYLQDHGAPMHMGPVAPSFEEEVDARSTMVRIWEANHKPGSPSDDYLESLVLVQHAGFMREYVWVYLSQPTWGDPPDTLNLEPFNQWRLQYLSHHEPLTLIGVGTHPDSLSH